MLTPFDLSRFTKQGERVCPYCQRFPVHDFIPAVPPDVCIECAAIFWRAVVADGAIIARFNAAMRDAQFQKTVENLRRAEIIL